MYQLSSTLAAAIAAGAPQRVLLEFTGYNPVRQFSNEDILISDGLRLTADFNPETDISIGNCPSAEVRFTLLNDSGQLDDFEFGQFAAYLGARIDSGTPASGAKTKEFSERGETKLYEFAPLGVFFAEKPTIVRKTTIEVDAYDRMILFEKDMPSATDLSLTYPTTISGIASALCQHVNVPLKSTTFFNSTIAVASEPEQFETATMREVIGWIAEAACSNARFDRSGSLEFAWFQTANKTFDEHNYSQFSAAWYETAAIDGLHIRNYNSTTEYVVGTGDNAYMIQNNPFLKQSGS